MEKCDIKGFKQFPLSLILEELEKASRNFQKYSDCLYKVKDIISSKFEQIKANIQNKTNPEKKRIVDEISSILDFLPKEYEASAKNLIKEIVKSYKENKKDTRGRIDALASNQEISDICKMINSLKKDGSNSDYAYAKNKLRDALYLIKGEINLAMHRKDLDIVFNKARVLKLKENLDSVLKESDGILTEIYDSITKLIKKALNILLNIEHKEDSAEIIEAFKIYSITMDFKIDCEKENMLSNMFGINNTIESMQASIIAFYEKLDNSYMEYKPPKNTIKCSTILNKIKQWDDFLQIFKEYQNHHPRFDILKIRGIRRYADFADDLNQTLYDFYDYILNFRIQNDEIKHPKLLEDRINNIKEKWDQIKSFEGVKIHLNSNIVNLKEIQSDVIKSISDEMYRIVEDASNLIKKDDIRKEDFNQIQIYYNCLTHFEANLSIKGFAFNNTLRMIEDKIYEKTLELKEKAEKGEGASEIVESMIGMKNISNNFSLLKKRLDSILDEFLETFRKKNKTIAVAILEELEKHPSGLGLCIITEHKFFEGVMQRLWLKKTQEHGIDYALEHIQGSNLNIEELNNNYLAYIEKLGEIQKIYLRLTSNEGVNTAIAQIVSEIQVLSKKYTKDCRNPNISLIKTYIPELLAYIAWLWVLLNIKKYNQDVNDEDSQIAFVTPHAIQVLSIFRMLGIGYNENTNPGNNLVQILTGEGKSITLAFLSSILALLGFDINCACYSEHLSKRDSQDFQPLYTALSICSYIKYGTFNQLCEDEINSKGDIREIVLDFIRFGRIPKISYRDNERPKILLIDEVDVFFTKSFYGNIYRPLAKLKDPTISNLTDYIWKYRKTPKLFEWLDSNEYNQCCQKFPGFEFLIEEAVKDMITHVRQFESHGYIVKNDKICYKENDGILSNIVYGYSTLFAYYLENEKGNISQDSLKENIFIGIKCGMFSFAEIPHKYKYIMGVTGTLEDLGDYEKNIIENEYRIKLKTLMPSVFGESNRKFCTNEDIYVENKDNYYNKILEQINIRIEGKKPPCKRAVLVFFEEEAKLIHFYNNSNLKNTDYDIQLMTESLSVEDRGMMIKKATVPNTVSLLTRAYGRGIDFKCYNHEVETNGGVHVIQVFLSENVSEETQIKGRSARQGQEGSYSMILLDDDLEKFQIMKEDIEEMKKNKTGIYESLNSKRNNFNQIKNANESNHVKQSKSFHDETTKFLIWIECRNFKGSKAFLQELNKGPSINLGISKAIVLMDATGSMSHLLQNAKNTVKIMFWRMCAVLSNTGINPECFQLQYCVYRNYSSTEDKILQVSPWTNNPDILERFMANVQPEGGWGNEAIEVGLWHVNNVLKNDTISQVILIGDMPPNTVDDIQEKRGKYISYWNQSKFRAVEHYKQELATIIDKKVPINAFYVKTYAKEAFEEIAALTKGQSGFLDINSISGADRLTDLVSTEILRKVAGEEAVNLYKEMYPPSYT